MRTAQSSTNTKISTSVHRYTDLVSKHRESLGLLIPTCIAIAFGIWTNLSSPIEIFGLLTGVACVYLAARENVWNWPIGLVNAGLYAYVYWQAGLKGETVLQGIYLILGVIGWYWWLHGGENKTEIHIVTTPSNQWLIVLPLTILSGIRAYFWLVSVHGAAPAIDGALVVTSLLAQYMMTRKYLEAWLFWILVDIIYVPMFLWKGLYLTAVLYGIFTFLAFGAVKYWLVLMEKQGTPHPKHKSRLNLARSLVCLGFPLAAWMAIECYGLEKDLADSATTLLRAPEKVLVTKSGNSAEIVDTTTVTNFSRAITDPLQHHSFSATYGDSVIEGSKIEFLGGGQSVVITLGTHEDSRYFRFTDKSGKVHLFVNKHLSELYEQSSFKR